MNETENQGTVAMSNNPSHADRLLPSPNVSHYEAWLEEKWQFVKMENVINHVNNGRQVRPVYFDRPPTPPPPQDQPPVSAPANPSGREDTESAKINGMLRKLEALRIAFDMRGANATTILRVVNTLGTMKNTMAAVEQERDELLNEVQSFRSSFKTQSDQKAQLSAMEARIQGHVLGSIPCPCTTFEQSEECPVGFPSLLCSACDGTGNAPIDKVVALAAEMMKIAEQAGELEDPFAAWETIDLIKSQHEQLRKTVEELKFALFSADMTIKDRADQAARLVLAASEGSAE